MAHFLPSWYKFFEHYECRGTSLIGAGKLSRYRIFVGGTGAVSRYKLSRSQKTVTVQDLNCVHRSVSGYKKHYKLVLSVGAKAKSVTNNLPILSVLGGVFICQSDSSSPCENKCISRSLLAKFFKNSLLLLNSL
jgi:hypothetical protein